MRKLFKQFSLFVLIFFAAVKTSNGESEMTISQLPNEKQSILVRLDGVLTDEKLSAFQQKIESIRNPVVIVFIDSQGGDWQAALKFGRFLRKVEATVWVTEQGCYSSCVMILAAGTHRTILGPVGIHRPYSTDVSAQTFQESQRRYRALQAETKKYLFEMNLPESLFDAMIQVPPESIHILTIQELGRFGLSQDDPAAQEIDDANEAREYGLTKEEYLRRKARREEICQNPAHYPSGIFQSRPQEAVELWANCRDAVMRDSK